MNAGEHGPDKLYPKFRVEKVSSGQEIDQTREFIFVLRPETNDRAAMAALKAYADVCQLTYPTLAHHIRAELRRIRHGESRDPERPLPTTREGWEAERRQEIMQHEEEHGVDWQAGTVSDAVAARAEVVVQGREWAGAEHKRQMANIDAAARREQLIHAAQLPWKQGHTVGIQGQFDNGETFVEGMDADRYYFHCECGVCGKPRRYRRQAVLDALHHLEAAGAA